LLIDRLKGLPPITQGIMKTRIYKRVISLGKQGGLPATKDASVQNIPILLLILGHMITDTAQGGLPVLLPYIKENLSLSYAQAGAIIFVFNLTSSIIQPLFGWLADRLSALWLVPLGIFASGLGMGLIGLAPSYYLLLPAVLIAGLGVASFHPEGYRCILRFSGQRKATGVSWFMVGGQVGLALGPLMATAFYHWAGMNGLLLFMVPTGITALLVLLSWKSLSSYRQGKPQNGDNKAQDLKPQPIGKRWPALSCLTAAVLIRSWMHAAVMGFVPFYYVQITGGDPLQVGNLMAVFLFAGALGTLTGAPIADKVGAKRFLVITLLLCAPLSWLFLISSGIWIFVTLGLLGAVVVGSFTVVIVMAGEILPDRAGMASGMMVGFAIGSGGAGAWVLGWVADHWGVVFALHFIPFIALAGALVAAMIPKAPPLEVTNT
jgi:FSR family fosmidomycin resistance protein-like MFS transporter